MARFSNEPYPCGTDVRFPTVGNPAELGNALLGQAPWIDGGIDVIGKPEERIPLNLTLSILPTRDPLYVSWISLGDKEKLFGLFPTFYRSGPPGIDLNTFPQLSTYSDIAKFWYLKPGDVVAAEMLADGLADFFNPKVEFLLKYNGDRLARDLAKAFGVEALHLH